MHQQAEQPAVEALALQQHQQRWRQVRGLGVTGEAFAQPQPKAAQPGALLASHGKADGPAQQHQQVQPEQAAQGPEHIHWALPVAQGGQCQACAAEHGQ
ncbi:hypothetical protein D9M71_566970 [compost metagenome]